ncbi:MAG: hypothetical protein JO068_10960 [Hyphomicrobiales bacterium]|nr:hypothetical protein [Hyphomicrobiales bacterium]
MSMKHRFYIPAVLLLTLGLGLASLSVARAAPLAPPSASEPLPARLPAISTPADLIEARYWRHRYYWRRHYWHRHYWHRHYWHRHYWHRHYWHRHYWYRRHWHYRRWHRWHHPYWHRRHYYWY